MVGSWSRGNIVLTSWKSARSGSDRQWSGSQYDKVYTVKLCRVGRDCGYDLFMDRFQSCVESDTSWDCRTQREGIRGQRVGFRGPRTDGREDRINITIASCLIGVNFTCTYISGYAYIYLCIYVYLLMICVYSWVEGNSTLLIVLMRKTTRLSPFRYQSMPIEAIAPIWYMVVAMVGQIVPVTYWWSCVAYSDLLKVAKSVTGSFFSRLGRFNRGSKSARAWVWSSTSWVQSCRSYQWSY